MKTCFKCGVEQPLDNFYKHKGMVDGHLGKCKECTKSDTKRYRLEKIDYYRAYDVARSKTPERKEHEYQRLKEYRKRYPERKRAHEVVAYAIKRGELTPQVCMVCGNKAEAHHPDYSHPLDVVWLCKAHHEELHHSHTF